MHIIHLGEQSILKKTGEFQNYNLIYQDILSSYPECSIIYYIKSTKEISHEDTGCMYRSYTKYSDLLEQIKNIPDTCIITTITESLVSRMHRLKKDLGQAYTPTYSLFTNKAKEREIIGATAPETIPTAILVDSEKKLSEQLLGLEFPVMVKPVAGVGSRGVMKAHNIDEVQESIVALGETFAILAQKGIENKDIIIEEFVTGPQFVINYRVDADQRIFLSLPTHVKTTQDINIAGYGNRYRIITKDIYEHFNKQTMLKLIEKTVNAGNIRNTYISHNFRISPAGTYKTIEINGRIGGYRLEMNRQAGGYNLYTPVITPQTYQEPSILKNVLTMSIWATQEGVLLGYDQELCDNIKQLSSYTSLRRKEKLIGKHVGFATHGGEPLGTLVCIHEDQHILEKDIETITQIYTSLCIFKE